VVLNIAAGVFLFTTRLSRNNGLVQAAWIAELGVAACLCACFGAGLADEADGEEGLRVGDGLL